MSKFAYAALVGAAMSLVVSNPAQAQQAAITSGGDVSADDATPLPPIVVESPTEPARKQGGKTPAGGVPGAGATAQGEGEEGLVEVPGVGIYTLGQLDLIGGSTITNDAMYTFNKNSLDQAVNILPGVTMQNSGGSRNERDILVRGFDRFRVPLYIDGVRIYLPYDNRLDYSRFLTPDLSQVQVQKGYVSVLNGPGGMGGAINLVSRKPTEAVEIEGRAGAVFDGDLGSMGQWNAYAYAGTRQKGYYAQISGNIVDQDHFDLSSDFTAAGPTTSGYLPGYPYEDGGNRDRSSFDDFRINAKIGITPNATDEYSINYTTQYAQKEAPLHVERQAVQGYFLGSNKRFWYWPEWDVSTLSWLSKTQLGSASYLKTNAYYNTFQNTLFFHADDTYTTRLSDSVYDDHSMGGFVEFGTELIPMNTFKSSVHYRRDIHDSWSLNYDSSGVFDTRDPTERSSEETWSFAVENTFHATRVFDVVTGASYDWNKVLKAEYWNDLDDDDPTNDFMDEYSKPAIGAWNWQAAGIYSYSRTGKAHASISSRTRTPTLFDRYSTRFGARTVNPDLEPERATNYEVGLSDTLISNIQVSTAVFYSDIEDSIQNAFAGANGNGSIIGFNADGENYGFEVSADWQATPTLRLGANYTYLERNLDFLSASKTVELGSGVPTNAQDAVAASQVEGTPRHQAFIYLAWKASQQWTLTPSLELAGDRTVLVTSCDSTLTMPGNAQNSGECSTPGASDAASRRPNYIDIGSYALVNFQAEYAWDANTTVALGATNLLDQNYALADGFPEPGRQFYVSARARF